jgi:hypothetical protein
MSYRRPRPSVPFLSLFASQLSDFGRPRASPCNDTPYESEITTARLNSKSLYDWLGFDTVADGVFRDLVIARIVEPTSKADSERVLTDLGAATVSYRTLARHLYQVGPGKYRDAVAAKCFDYSSDCGGLSLLLYDVTTLYFEAESEDDLRKVGYSKERRVDPQIVIGLLVDRTGFPLKIGCFEGNTAETTTIVSIITSFLERQGLTDTPMVGAADAGIRSQSNLTALDELKLSFIVGSRMTKAPGDLQSHFHLKGDLSTDGQLIDTVTPRHGNTRVNDAKKRAEPVWDPDCDSGAWWMCGLPTHWIAPWWWRSTVRATTRTDTGTAMETVLTTPARRRCRHGAVSAIAPQRIQMRRDRSVRA